VIKPPTGAVRCACGHLLNRHGYGTNAAGECRFKGCACMYPSVVALPPVDTTLDPHTEKLAQAFFGRPTFTMKVLEQKK
jgi:hypothetical protein